MGVRLLRRKKRQGNILKYKSMSNVLLIILLVVCVAGAVFTIIVASCAMAVCSKNQEEILRINKSLDALSEELENIREFDSAVTDCIGNIGNSLDIINNRTNWLDGVDSQISNIFTQNKDGNE